MKRTRVLLAAIGLTLTGALFVFAGCQNVTGGIAATVNGDPIMEQDVTAAIETVRGQQEAYQDPATWAQALAMSGYTPESFRETVIMSMAQDIVITQEAASRGLFPDLEKIEADIAQTRTTSGAESDAAWLEILHSYGFKDEQAYREFLRMGQIKALLLDDFVFDPSDDELRTFIAANPYAVDGFTPPVAAADSAADDTAAAEETNPDGLNEEEEDAELDETVNEEVTPEETPKPLTAADIDLNTIPKDILEQFTELWSKQNKGLAFSEWVTGLVDNADIVINDMPEGLPYDVDMSLAESDDSEADDSANDSADNPPYAYYSSPEGIAAAMAEGLEISDDVVGDGAEAVDGSTVHVHYILYNADGSERENNEYTVTIGTTNVIAGWHAGLVGMRVGGTRTLLIPPSLAYGQEGASHELAGQWLVFVIELLDVQ